MRKSIISFVLACLVLLPLTAPAEQPLVMAGYEDQESYRLWSENLFFKRMEQLTGLVFEYRQAQSADGWEKTKAGFYSGEADLPQVLFKAELSPAETIDMLDAGILIVATSLSVELLKPALACAANADDTTRAQEQALRDQLAVL